MQGGDPQGLAGDPAGHDAGEMLKGGVEIDGDAVEGHPLPDAHPDGGDLVLPPAAAIDPDADPARAALAADIEAGQGRDDPFLEVADIGADIRPVPALQVEHDIADPLAGAVIGVLAAPAGPVDREAVGGQEIGRLGAGARRIEGGMLQEPGQLRRGAGADILGPGIHDAEGGVIVDRGVVDPPFHVFRGLPLLLAWGWPIWYSRRRLNTSMRSWRNW